MRYCTSTYLYVLYSIQSVRFSTDDDACQVWLNCKMLEASVPAFRGLCKSFEKHGSLWQQYFSVSTEDVCFILRLFIYIFIYYHQHSISTHMFYHISLYGICYFENVYSPEIHPVANNMRNILYRVQYCVWCTSTTCGYSDVLLDFLQKHFSRLHCRWSGSCHFSLVKISSRLPTTWLQRAAPNFPCQVLGYTQYQSNLHSICQTTDSFTLKTKDGRKSRIHGTYGSFELL